MVTRLALSLMALASLVDVASGDALIEGLLEKLPSTLLAATRDPVHEVQILYTQIDRQKGGGVAFTSHAFNVDARRYFYPASTVKLPVALVALEKLATLNIPSLTRDTTMITGAAEPWQTAASGSIGSYLRKIFLVSDNDAFNRLFEFTGVDVIHASLGAKGFAGSHIVRRLAVGSADFHGRYANPIQFVNGAGETMYTLPARISQRDYWHGQTVLRGRAYIHEGDRVEQPFDFSRQNAFPLSDQVTMLRAFLFPESVASEQRFSLREDDRRFLLQVMSEYPRESRSPQWTHPDTYVKPLLAWHAEPVSDSLRCFNKVGSAYGYLIDNAYFVDFEEGIDYMLAAVIYTNANETFNDNVYEYETLAEPFFRELGRVIHAHELQRERVIDRAALEVFRCAWSS